ncbi:LysR family transcriptional regulator [Chitiniphilus shinanonensis]|uniref:LysR family transcriptional regulator n=2 Tax=Chitiniphilus shinanonensis TaxID=553088 RepID=UPI00307278AE
MSDRLNGVVTFVHAVEAGSFALAAERMHLSRSAVGKTIARLEQRLGVRLFQRTTRRQSLTDAGHAYYERCVRALAELDAGAAMLDAGQREPSGRLRVSAPVLFGRQCVAPLLTPLLHAWPRLGIDLSFNDRPVDLVAEGFDLAIRIGPLADTPNLAARRLGSQHMAICAAPAYLAERGTPASVAQMAGHAGIVYSHGGRDSVWRVRDGDGLVREVERDIRLRLDDLQAIVDAAVAGAGLAWLPCWLVTPYVQRGELVLVMDAERVVGHDIHAIWPATPYLPPRTRVAIDALAAGLPAQLGK